MTTAPDYNVKIIADSINPCGNRLTTFELTYPRMVHAELMTHRLFSRNASSSRAIPSARLREYVDQNPVMPKWWGKNQSGMQAREELTGATLAAAKEAWLRARNYMLMLSEQLEEIGLHKQIVNRLIEPWMFITVLVSATEYDNWFFLRDHPDAQPEIAWVAAEMYKLYIKHTPAQLACGQWHLPLVELKDPASPMYVDLSSRLSHSHALATLRKISVGRCARVSYLTHDGVRDIEKDIELHDRLAGTADGKNPPHMSPFEHVAKALDAPMPSGNFRGWQQYRKMFEHEHHGGRRP